MTAASPHLDAVFRLALCGFNLGLAGDTPRAFRDGVDRRLARARADGARLLVLPEYLSEAFLAWKPAGLAPTAELAFMAGEARDLMPALSDLAVRHGTDLLAGTMPAPDGAGGHVNRALLFCADGGIAVQDKLALTPFERDPAAWSVTPGRRLSLVRRHGLTIAILICLDVEMPALARKLAAAEVDLVLVPSMTSGLAGYARVFGCARARAVELMAAVAVCGCVGVARGAGEPSSNVSGAALFLPCEPSLGSTGIGGEVPATDGLDGSEPWLVADVPLAEIRRLRAGAAEVWPGAWSAEGIDLVGAPAVRASDEVAR